ncbi:MAG: hypothetical protein ABIQ16_25355 [Polyangiaceae bacterium]
MAEPRKEGYLGSMEMSQQLRIYDVLSIRVPSSSPHGGKAQTQSQQPDRLLGYFDWLVSGPVGPREKAWAKHAHGRLA